jgi:FkbM family methyltransferase
MIKRILKRLKRQIQKLDENELISARIGKFDLFLPRNHPLPGYMRSNPEYCWNSARIASLVKEKYSDLHLIDIGANIGDTVAFCRSLSEFPILCIEGSSVYFPTLVRNIAKFENVEAHQLYLGEEKKSVLMSEEIAGGTGRLTKNSNNKPRQINVTTLDEFLQYNQSFKKSKMIKVDTDGHDVKILRGAKKFIELIHPIIFMEYDHVFLREAGEDGLAALRSLEYLGYSKIIYYDNRGRLLLSSSLDDHRLIAQLHDYLAGRKSAYAYYDLCVFHQEDCELADKIIEKEENHRLSVS